MISLSLLASNGIVIATEKKSPSILVDDSMLEKVAVVCPNIGIVYSGMGPDFRVLITKARKSAQAYWKMYGEYPPTRVLTQEIANVMQQATQSGCASDLHCDDMPQLKRYQWCTAVWCFPISGRLGYYSRAYSIPSGSFRIVLGMEGQCHRKEYG